MASSYTPNLGLSQWWATDPILRSDFNSDNQKIDSALGSIPRIVAGSYIGTGAYGSDSPRSLSFTFTPILVVITTDAGYGHPGGAVFIIHQESSAGIGNYSDSTYGLNIHLEWGTNRITWYSTDDAEKQLNASGQLYHYFAIGL